MRNRKDGPSALGDPRGVTAAPIKNMLVADVLVANPAAAQVFIRRGMGCVGCAFARFETVAEVAAVYGFDACELAMALTDTGVANVPGGFESEN